MNDACVVDEWIVSMPELATRPLAVLHMRQDAKLRVWIQRVHHDLIGTATRLVNHPTAAEILVLLWKVRSADFLARWKPKLPLPTFAQCYSVMRNIYANAVHRATGKPQTFGVYDVPRRLPDAIRARLLRSEPVDMVTP